METNFTWYCTNFPLNQQKYNKSEIWNQMQRGENSEWHLQEEKPRRGMCWHGSSTSAVSQPVHINLERSLLFGCQSEMAKGRWIHTSVKKSLQMPFPSREPFSLCTADTKEPDPFFLYSHRTTDRSWGNQIPSSCGRKSFSLSSISVRGGVLPAARWVLAPPSPEISWNHMHCF